MKNSYEERMSKLTDKELDEILSHKYDWNPEALTAAEIEIQKRCLIRDEVHKLSDEELLAILTLDEDNYDFIAVQLEAEKRNISYDLKDLKNEATNPFRNLNGLFARLNVNTAIWNKKQTVNGIFSNGEQIKFGTFIIGTNHSNLSSFIEEEANSLSTDNIKEIDVTIDLTMTGNYLINSLIIQSSDENSFKKDICSFTYDPFRKFRDILSIKLIKKGILIDTDTYEREKIFDFIEAIEFIIKKIFPNSTINQKLNIHVLSSYSPINQYGLVGVAVNVIAEIFQAKETKKFLNNEITLKDGTKFGDFCGQHNWEVNIFSK